MERTAIDIVLSVALTWGMGLAPVLILRYAVFRKPLAKRPAIWVTVGIAFFLVILFAGLATLADTEPNMAPAAIITFLSFGILRRGHTDPEPDGPG